mmetsp:Transcript_16936/g.22700  ORF Transcript_16936/g.22700 Transcript_16936/m.22700 type:complete len:88 (+) Transcript_16936:145-408(+)
MGTIPAELGALSSLETLSLFGNRLTGTIPAELGALSSLETLVLQSNNLSGSMPSDVCNLRTTNGGVLRFLEADCISEVVCSCCTTCF